MIRAITRYMGNRWGSISTKNRIYRKNNNYHRSNNSPSTRQQCITHRRSLIKCIKCRFRPWQSQPKISTIMLYNKIINKSIIPKITRPYCEICNGLKVTNIGIMAKIRRKIRMMMIREIKGIR